jgi:hypothetical protein
MNKQYIRTLLDETIKGVSVIFNPEEDEEFNMAFAQLTPKERQYAAKRAALPESQKSYLYLTRFDCAVGDYLVVEARGIFKTVKVVEVHDEPPIDETTPIEYKWVLAKLDMVGYCDLLKAESDALAKITNASRGHHRKMARSALLSSFPELANIDVTPDTTKV